MKILKPHQNEAVTYLGSRFQGALLMGMRLGKNLSIITHLFNQNITKVLFVTEYGAMRSIEKELTEYGIENSVLDGNRQKRLNTLRDVTDGWVISNYESAERLELHKEEWQAVILDETIKIANPKSQATKHFLKNYRNVRLRFILNGYPSPEGYHQLCCQFLFLHGVYFGCKTFWQYRHKFFVKEMIEKKDGGSFPEYTMLSTHRTDVYNYIHKYAFVLTREEAKVGSEKVFEKRYVKQTPELKRAIKELCKHYAYEDVEYVNDLGLQIGLSYMASGLSPSPGHRIISFKKFQALWELIEKIDDDKILIWCRFRAEQDIISTMLQEKDMAHIVINGDVKKSERDECKEYFESANTKACALLTIKSCAKGQDWACSNTSIYFSNEWSNDLRTQSEERLIHLTKTTPVLIVDTITENSTDEDVVTALKDKQFDSKQLLSTYIRRLTKKGVPTR